MSFLVDVLQNEQSLTALEYAGRCFVEIAGLKLKPLLVEQLLAWWAENQSHFQEDVTPTAENSPKSTPEHVEKIQ